MEALACPRFLVVVLVFVIYSGPRSRSVASVCPRCPPARQGRTDVLSYPRFSVPDRSRCSPSSSLVVVHRNARPSWIPGRSRRACRTSPRTGRRRRPSPWRNVTTLTLAHAPRRSGRDESGDRRGAPGDRRRHRGRLGSPALSQSDPAPRIRASPALGPRQRVPACGCPHSHRHRGPSPGGLPRSGEGAGGDCASIPLEATGDPPRGSERRTSICSPRDDRAKLRASHAMSRRASSTPPKPASRRKRRRKSRCSSRESSCPGRRPSLSRPRPRYLAAGRTLEAAVGPAGLSADRVVGDLVPGYVVPTLDALRTQIEGRNALVGDRPS